MISARFTYDLGEVRHLVETSGDGERTCPRRYIPSHLYYCMFELIKNSLRATCEHHGLAGELPAVKVIIADGESNEDIVIKVSDEGGGIRRSDMPRIWSYLFTTAVPAFESGRHVSRFDPRDSSPEIRPPRFNLRDRGCHSISARWTDDGGHLFCSGAFSSSGEHSTDTPLAGLGYGLPISRGYARYFGGDLNIMSMEGHGTDAFLHLPRLGNKEEPLP